jgi:hypothetical protein
VIVFDQDFFAFRRMILPVVIQFLFWIGVAFVVFFAIGTIAYADGNGWQIAYGIGVLLIGPILIRIYCEFLVVVFRINETLSDIRRDVSRLMPQAIPDHKVCGNCGKESPAGDKYCRSCGQPL